jgi:hypothetical protein
MQHHIFGRTGQQRCLDVLLLLYAGGHSAMDALAAHSLDWPTTLSFVASDTACCQDQAHKDVVRRHCSETHGCWAACTYATTVVAVHAQGALHCSLCAGTIKLRITLKSKPQRFFALTTSKT